MSAKRGQTDLSGVLLVDKPAGMTSHDVVDRVRRLTGERRVGHAGTLDPLATGLLVVLVGPATRLAPYLTSAEKSYRARVVFGTETDTDDAEGRVTVTASVPDEVCDPFFAASTVAALVGTHEQIPPAYSAIKRGGVVAYEAARAGEAIELEPRSVQVVSATLVGVECTGEVAWDIEFAVSKGTYVRALARDLGRALNTAAHLGALRRVRSGAMDVTSAYTLEQIETATRVDSDSRAKPTLQDGTGSSDQTEHGAARLFVDAVAALGLSAVQVEAPDALLVSNGGTLDAAAVGAGALEHGESIAVVHAGVLLGVYARSGSQLKPQVIIPGGVRGVR